MFSVLHAISGGRGFLAQCSKIRHDFVVFRFSPLEKGARDLAWKRARNCFLSAVADSSSRFSLKVSTDRLILPRWLGLLFNFPRWNRSSRKRNIGCTNGLIVRQSGGLSTRETLRLDSLFLSRVRARVRGSSSKFENDVRSRPMEPTSSQARCEFNADCQRSAARDV